MRPCAEPRLSLRGVLRVLTQGYSEYSQVSLAAGDSHLLLNDDRGRVWAVGHNRRGQTGLPYRPRYSRPQRLLDVEA